MTTKLLLATMRLKSRRRGYNCTKSASADYRQRSSRGCSARIIARCGRGERRSRGALRAWSEASGGDEPTGGGVATNELVRDEKREATIRRVDALAHLLDDSIPVPGTGMRFGLDAVIGLVPGFGDVAGALLSSWIVLEGARLGAGISV